jgi:hypothetical protein
VRFESEISRQGNRPQPELGGIPIPINVNVVRLIQFMTPKIETVWSIAQNGGHGILRMSVPGNR